MIGYGSQAGRPALEASGLYRGLGAGQMAWDRKQDSINDEVTMRTINRCRNCGSLMRLYALDDWGRPVYLCTRSLIDAERRHRTDMVPCGSLYLVVHGRLTPVPAVLVDGRPARAPLISSFSPDFRPRPRLVLEPVQESGSTPQAGDIEPLPEPELAPVEVAA